MLLTLDTKIEQLTRVGRSTATLLGKLGIRIVAELLRHYPFRYDDFGLILPIAKLSAGITATVGGKIELITNRRSPRRRMMLTEAVISDASGEISAVWFNQPYLTRMFKPGDEVYLAGQVTYEFHQLQFINPSLEQKKSFTLHTARLVPIYPTTTGLTQRQIRFLIQQALPACREVVDPLPSELRKRTALPARSWSLQQLHFPDHRRHLEAALRRLKFEELFVLQLALQQARWQLRQVPAQAILFQRDATARLVRSLPFTLTQDQRVAAWKILQDLQRSVPMHRLLEGDVGAGKTVVVALAALNVALSGGQTAVMAPTEILAAQHFQTFCRWFGGFPVAVGLFTRTQRLVQLRDAASPRSDRLKKSEILAMLSRGELDLVVGTHALLQESVRWQRLTLAVVDEQHRFGVEQRQLLVAAGNGVSPHFLSLTATPIPRSLALVLYGDLSITAIRQRPRERKPIMTQLVSAAARPRLYQFIRGQVAAGRQAFVVCPLIDLSDRFGVKAVTAEQAELQQRVFPDLRVSVLHGKLSAEKKAATMADFLANRTSVLVTTTVVEVGVDVPNATIMVIEGAERFGLSQLHQLRGRVGRSGYQSHCFLCTEATNPVVIERLAAFLRAEDGFALAEMDLKFRGPGQLLGTLQSGFTHLRLATLADLDLAEWAKTEAAALLHKDPELAQHAVLQRQVVALQASVHLE
ncbi:MAG: ATP-dependent DNA helicase RecG [Parcubacteria group bacterium Gr01-1014_31]|nr:MAG: ATP-dependent DNA helicase RecG [Parcubacteria group bacterium Gr01-1014_31]